MQEVYFLQESGVGAIKIGITTNLNARVRTVQTNTPHEIVVLGSMHADQKFEWELHHKFEYARIRGEWFRPVAELLKHIE